jgi:hypothetical protein
MSIAVKWMEQKIVILSEISQAQKVNNCLFSFIKNYRPKTSTLILLNTGHTLRGDCTMGGLRKGKETKT